MSRITWKSFGLLITFVIILLSLFKDTKGKWLVLAAVGVWAAYVSYPRIAVWVSAARARRKERQTRRHNSMVPVKLAARGDNDNQDTAVIERLSADLSSARTYNQELEAALIRQFSCRITEKLHSAYPKAIWSWIGNNLLEVASGGTGRIKTIDTGEYSQADIIVDRFGQIGIQMLKVAQLHENEKPDKPTPVTDVSVWYENIGSPVLEPLIGDLQVRGHRSLSILANGDVTVTGIRDALVRLADFPKEGDWVSLLQTLNSRGLEACIKGKSIQVNW